jgi:hypothetical protein
MLFPLAKMLVGFCKPPSAFVPSAIEDIIATTTTETIRGSMALAHVDFLGRVKQR